MFLGIYTYSRTRSRAEICNSGYAARTAVYKSVRDPRENYWPPLIILVRQNHAILIRRSPSDPAIIKRRTLHTMYTIIIPSFKCYLKTQQFRSSNSRESSKTLRTTDALSRVATCRRDYRTTLAYFALLVLSVI